MPQLPDQQAAERLRVTVGAIISELRVGREFERKEKDAPDGEARKARARWPAQSSRPNPVVRRLWVADVKVRDRGWWL
jgi:hypothetical protein